MDRSDVVATTACVWAVVAWRAWRRAEPRSYRSYLLLLGHALLVIVALASKEVSIVLPAVLAAWAVFEGDLAATRRRCLVTIVPAAAISGIYFVARHAVLERYAHGQSATELSLDPLRFVTSLAWYLRNAWPLSINSSLRQVPIAEAKSVGVLLTSIATLAIAVLVGVWALRRRHVALGALMAWMLLGLVPVLMTRDIAVPTADDRYSLANRWLYFSLGPLLVVFALLAMEGLRYLRERSRSPAAARASTAVVMIMIAGWATVMLARSAADREWISSEMAMVNAEDHIFYQSIPPQFRTRFDDCRHEQRAMITALWRQQPAEAAERGPSALARCPDDAEVKLFYLDALVQLKRYEEAEGLARDLVRSPPRDARNHGRIAFLAGVTLLERGDTAGARPLLVKAVSLGYAKCGIFVDLAQEAEARGRFVEAASALETAFQCGGRRDVSLRVAEAILLYYAGERDTARKVLNSLAGLTLSGDLAARVQSLQQALDAETTGKMN
ncbi:MAG: hypothetical protein A2Y62_08095 [Candidatus Fischerbacteria bacterium RBG_13_37_8]|uniref:Tetratricopeptide repeat protein n=1 Tax=Candidatus Fischerbacteria bacterium RBG_13_37_8 TaxID=1817863 RepID=A0A1F5VV75_9BACT|nr:MAG: hypothetical protein A2Y62_08095 [Candidatus Fischerbacteria bacterium RBG_13_37_8]